MKLEIGKRYVVTKASADGTFDVGDHVWSAENGDVLSRECGGWIPAKDVKEATKGWIVEIDRERLKREIKRLRKELIKLIKEEK